MADLFNSIVREELDLDMWIAQGRTLDEPITGGKHTLLHVAVELGAVGLAKNLLARGANPDVRDKHGDTPLHLAATDGDEEMVRLLLEYRADPNVQADDGNTPLHCAAAGNPLKEERT